MKRFITSSDIEFLSLTGQRTLSVDENDVITSVAREAAEKLGVILHQKQESNGPRYSPDLGLSERSSARRGPFALWPLSEPSSSTPVQIPVSPQPDTFLLKNGRIVWPGEGSFTGDLRISKGKISGICEPSVSSSQREIDVSRKYILPGIIDPHVHLGIFSPFEADAGIETKAGLWGGVTTVGCFLYSSGSYFPLLEELTKKVRAHSFADVFFHLTIANRNHLEEIPGYVKNFGIRSFKIYMSGVPGIIPDIDDGFLTRVYERMMETGKRCTVCIHAENASLVRWATEEIQSREVPQLSVQEWSETHPPLAEEEAIRRAALLVKRFEGVSTYFVHVSTKEGMRAITQARCDGSRVFAETTSPYLLFSIEQATGNLPKWLPPLRTRENLEALWESLREGRIDSLGTDSVPMGEEIKGLDKSVWEAMPNAPTLEHHLPGILTEGVIHREIPMAKIVDLMTRRPAELFSVFPSKGSLFPGMDADLVVVDMDRWRKVKKEELKSGCPFSLYEGRLLTGWPALVIKGGEVVIKDGCWVADPPPARVLNERGSDIEP